MEQSGVPFLYSQSIIAIFFLNGDGALFFNLMSICLKRLLACVRGGAPVVETRVVI